MQQQMQAPPPSGPCILDITTDKQYYTVGDVIQARFTMQLNEKIKIKSIRLSMNQVEILGGEAVGCLFSKMAHDSPNQPLEFPPGPYQFDFEYRVHELVSQDFRREVPLRCGIRHSLSILIDRPGLLNKNFSKEVAVIIFPMPSFTLNGFDVPYRFQGEKDFVGVMGMDKGKILVTVATEKSHFVLGESINVSLYFDCTRAKLEIKSLNLLLRRVFYLGKTEAERLTNVKTEPLDRVALSFEQHQFQIPVGQAWGSTFVLNIPPPDGHLRGGVREL